MRPRVGTGIGSNHPKLERIRIFSYPPTTSHSPSYRPTDLLPSIVSTLHKGLGEGTSSIHDHQTSKSK
eukprot:scaffold598_cov318-Pavlova_lutheri.AAC.13